MLLLQAHLGKERCCLASALQWTPGDRGLICWGCTVTKVLCTRSPELGTWLFRDPAGKVCCAMGRSDQG